MRSLPKSLLVPLLVAVCSSIPSTCSADKIVEMYLTTEQGMGKKVGTITISETKYGLLLTPKLNGLALKPGVHGFHLHENPSCSNNGMAAGAHLDPDKTDKHLGPYNDKGHLGDLPALTITEEGKITLPVLAPRLMTLKEMKDHALMIHEGGDNYSDSPEKLGGGGSRMICGIIK